MGHYHLWATHFCFLFITFYNFPKQFLAFVENVHSHTLMLISPCE